MKTQKSFANCDRYVFDFKYCNSKKGFAQLETTEDAHYFGNWVNFKSFEFVSYVEGDIIIKKCDNKEEREERGEQGEWTNCEDVTKTEEEESWRETIKEIEKRRARSEEKRETSKQEKRIGEERRREDKRR